VQLTAAEKRTLIRALTICIESDHDRLLGSYANEGYGMDAAKVLTQIIDKTQSVLNKVTDCQDD
jgi:hypothetical protein